MVVAMETSDFAEHCAAVRARFQEAVRADRRPQPDLPFSLDGGGGDTLSALEGLRGTLAGLLTIVFGIAAAITAMVTVRPVWILSTLGLTLVALIVWFTTALRKKRLGQVWRREATAWPAALVMAHDSAWQPGASMVPGSVVVDFGSAPDPGRLIALAETLYDLDENAAPSREEEEVIAWIQLEMQRARFGRMRVPPSIADGADSCWLVSLRLDRKAMPHGHLDRKLWFVAGRPDRQESVELLPHEYWVDGGPASATD